MPQTERGILVDYQGHFLGALEWDASGPPPNFNVPRRGFRRVLPADVKHLLTDLAAIDALPGPDARWNFTSEQWEMPSQVVYLVDLNGQYRGKRTVWPSRFVAPSGVEVINTPPPETKSRRAIWCGDVDGWQFPRRVALVDQAGIVRNTALESPRSGTPDIDVPPGWDRINMDDNPRADGNPLVIGDDTGTVFNLTPPGPP